MKEKNYSNRLLIFCLSISWVFNYSYSQHVFGLQLGSFGVGANYEFHFNKNANLRASASFLYWEASGVKKSRDFEVIARNQLRTGGVGVYFDHRLFEKIDWLRGSVGLVYNFNKISGQQYCIYTKNLEPEFFGSLDLTIKTFPVNPYVGVLIGNYNNKRKINFGLEVATLFHGTPKVSFTGVGEISPTAEQEPLIQSNVKNYYFLPMVNFRLTFNLD